MHGRTLALRAYVCTFFRDASEHKLEKAAQTVRGAPPSVSGVAHRATPPELPWHGSIERRPRAQRYARDLWRCERQDAIVIIMQCLYQDDLAGHVMARDDENSFASPPPKRPINVTSQPRAPARPGQLRVRRVKRAGAHGGRRATLCRASGSGPTTSRPRRSAASLALDAASTLLATAD